MILKTYPIKVTQGYSRQHKAIDVVGLNNGKMVCDYITAQSDGIVSAVVSNYMTNDKTGSSYGNHVIIRHSAEFSTLYAHMKYGSVTVKVGDEVKAGDIIGYMGNTGHSIGAHLHFEVRRNNIKIDPNDFLNTDLSREISYQIGKNYKLDNYMNVRTAPNITAPIVSFEKLTADAKKHCVGNRAVLKKGTVVTCLSIVQDTADGSVWMRIPSGFVCAIMRGEVFIK